MKSARRFKTERLKVRRALVSTMVKILQRFPPDPFSKSSYKFADILKASGVVAGGEGGPCPPSDKFLGALKSKRGAKIRNSNEKSYSNVKYYTKYVKSSLSTISKIVM